MHFLNNSSRCVYTFLILIIYHSCTVTLSDAEQDSAEQIDPVLQTAINLILDPNTVHEVTDPESRKYLSDLELRMESTKNDKGDVHSVAESLEFVIDHYRRARNWEDKLDKYLPSLDILKEEESFFNKMNTAQKEVGLLKKRLGILIRSTEQGVLNSRKEYTKVFNELVGEVESAAANYVKRWKDLRRNMTSNEQFLQMNIMNMEMFEELGRYSDMSQKDFVLHLAGVQRHVGIWDGDTKGLDLNEKAVVDLSLFETLLEMHQKLEGAQNLILVEIDKEKKNTLENEIKQMQIAIPKFILENKKQLQTFCIASVSTGFRSLKKMDKFERMFKEIEVVQNKHKMLNNKYAILMTELKELVAEAERTWTKMSKVEL